MQIDINSCPILKWTPRGGNKKKEHTKRAEKGGSY